MEMILKFTTNIQVAAWVIVFAGITIRVLVDEYRRQ